jgi:uncharacterized protein
MPSSWSRSWEVDRLVAGRQRFEGAIPLADLPRLRDRLYLEGAENRAAQAALSFERELDADVARVEVRAQLPLRCERCLRRFDFAIDDAATLALIPALAAADRAPAGFEPVLCEGGWVRPQDVVEEQILLALPLIARHEDAAVCEAGAAPADPESAADEITQKPFAGLAELLQRR